VIIIFWLVFYLSACSNNWTDKQMENNRNSLSVQTNSNSQVNTSFGWKNKTTTWAIIKPKKVMDNQKKWNNNLICIAEEKNIEKLEKIIKKLNLEITKEDLCIKKPKKWYKIENNKIVEIKKDGIIFKRINDWSYKIILKGMLDESYKIDKELSNVYKFMDIPVEYGSGFYVNIEKLKDNYIIWNKLVKKNELKLTGYIYNGISDYLLDTVILLVDKKYKKIAKDNINEVKKNVVPRCHTIPYWTCRESGVELPTSDNDLDKLLVWWKIEYYKNSYTKFNSYLIYDKNGKILFLENPGCGESVVKVYLNWKKIEPTKDYCEYLKKELAN